MVYSALFNIIIEALNLISEKSVSEIQLPGNFIIQLLSIPQRSTKSSTQICGMACQWRFPSHHMNLKCCCSLQKLVAEHFCSNQALLSFLHSTKHARTFPQTNLGKMVIKVML